MDSPPPAPAGPADPYERIAYLEARNEQLAAVEAQMQGLLQEIRVQHEELKAQNRELKRIGRELEASNGKYRNLFDLAPIGYASLDEHGALLELNVAGAHLLGRPRTHLRHVRLIDLVVAADRDKIEVHLAKVLGGRHDTVEVEVRVALDRTTPVVLRSAPTVLPESEETRCQTAIVDLSDHRQTEAQLRRARDYLQHLAHHDPLTEMPNRLLFNDRLRHALHRARRTGQGVALLFLDIDRFKLVNDSLGHAVGDKLLCEVAARIRGCVRESDTVCRMGGDEFTVILEEVDSTRDVESVSQKLLSTLRQPFRACDHEVVPGASIGVSLYPSDALDSADLVKFADAAMYRSKRMGGNTAHFFSSKLDASRFDRLSLERELRGALDRLELVLHYQPQRSALDGAIEGLEALARWLHPVHGTLMPSEFIPTAEESDLIDDLGRWALREVCEQHRRWTDRGLSPPRIAVNVSARQLNQPDLVDFIARTLSDSGTHARALELELTESTLLLNPDAAIDVFREIRALGVQIAIDDFGTGYSSLSRLRQLPLSKLKIDQAFVHGLESNQDDRAIANAIISMGHDLHLGVVSEGVESAAQQQFLESSGCDLLQGYRLGRPLDAAQTETLLREAS